MISTGSMAPTLVGYHRPAECPHCAYCFERGSVPPSLRSHRATTEGASASEVQRPEPTRCPNCGERFEVSTRRTEGDQLLVHKHAYAEREPRRWEVVVFRNPSDPTEAYIKRVAGLPGETITIRSGDVVADGTLCRKDATTQRAMRLPVASAAYPMVNSSRWQLDPRWLRSTDSGHGVPFLHDSVIHDSFRRGPLRNDDGQGVHFVHDGDTSSIRYQHRTRSGGRHRTTVAIDSWPTAAPPAAPRLAYRDGHLHCIGVLPESVRDRLLGFSDDAAYRSAIRDLAERSQIGYITDACGYNRPGQPEYPVRDLMWTGHVALQESDARFDVRLLYGRQPFVLTVTSSQFILSTLAENGTVKPLSAITRLTNDPVTLEFSVFDRQLTVTADGAPLWEPQPFAATALSRRPSRKPLTMSATGRVELSHVALWRDVYVTPPESTADATCLDQDSYFVLGDNSPVSVDSRRWPIAEVPRGNLIGKPLVVHLPSRQVELPGVGPLRVPDLSRVRLVR